MSRKIANGFTLIELLIVIAIIGILAVAFLPSVLGAPAKGRDAARVADVQKIQNALINYNLEGNAYPVYDNAPINPSTTFVTGKTWTDEFAKGFGGKFPVDPQKDGSGKDQYYIYLSPAGDYSFALYSSHMETLESANTTCAGIQKGTIIPPKSDTLKAEWCYGVLVE